MKGSGPKNSCQIAYASDRCVGPARGGGKFVIGRVLDNKRHDAGRRRQNQERNCFDDPRPREIAPQRPEIKQQEHKRQRHQHWFCHQTEHEENQRQGIEEFRF